MNGKRFIYTLMAVFLTTAFFYGFSSVGALAYSKIVSPVKKFTEQTYIGPFDVRGLDEHAAKDKLSADFTELHGKLGAELTYLDATVELPAESISFDVEQTIEHAVPGEENPIIAKVSREGLRTVLDQHFSHFTWTGEDVESIATGIEQELQPGIVPVNVHVTDYITAGVAEAEIASYSLKGVSFSPILEEMVNELDGTRLEWNAQFSMLDFMQSNGSVVASNADLTFLASALYGAILKTNLDVVERNIGRALNPSIPAGFEAAVNQQLGLDFIIRNPNHSSFTLKMEMTGETLTASFIGLPLQYTYDAYVVQKEEFKPRTVRRYSASVPTGQVQHAEEGQEGLEVTVNRMVIDNGTVLEDKMISSDFYAPQPTIEIHPLQKEETAASGNTDNAPHLNGQSNTTDDGTNLGTNDGQSSGSNNGPGPASGSSANGANSSNDNTSKEPGTKPGKTDSNYPFVPPAEDSDRYDKGGNLIK